MSNRTIYTRAYSSRSAGGLTSGKRPAGRPLSPNQLLAEFPRHADLGNRIPTSFVSVSTRIVDTIQRAFQKHHELGEHPADIWVAFIQAPADADQTRVRVHSAQDLARQSAHPQPWRFHYEVLFEWGIPEDCILHQVSLQTLMDRGLPEWTFQSTEGLRYSLATEFKEEASFFDIGLNLGFMARPFGARAPVEWIAYQLYSDCVRFVFDCNSQMVDLLHYGQEDECSGRVDLDVFCLLDQGVDIAVMDWWLADSDFAGRYRDFKSWRIGRWKSLHAEKGVGFMNNLSAEIQRCEEDIEAKAVELGL